MNPLVSCVMPTTGRKQLAALAVECFLAQDYPAKSLTILDDWDDPSFPNGIEHELIQYHLIDYLIGKLNIPQKRNRVNALASGDILVHVDSDDWSAPDRLSQQVTFLEESGKSVIGYHSLLFFDERLNKVARYVAPQNIYALGTSLMYRRRFWEAHPFIEGRFTGSDTDFVRFARDAKQLATLDGGQMMVARCHDNNTGPKDIRKPGFVAASLSELPQGFVDLVSVHG